MIVFKENNRFNEITLIRQEENVQKCFHQVDDIAFEKLKIISI